MSQPMTYNNYNSQRTFQPADMHCRYALQHWRMEIVAMHFVNYKFSDHHTR